MTTSSLFIPQHIAFILDGNRRWAKEHKLPQLVGHKKGFERAKSLVDFFIQKNIKYVTYFMFSTENWNRTAEEVSYLMNLFRDFFASSINFLNERNIRVIAIGDLNRFSEDLIFKIKKIEEATKNNSGLVLIAAVSYSGRDDILRAAKKLAVDFVQKKIDIEKIDENAFSMYLDTANIPYPDILVRTGEKRISNFLLWQCAYSEIFFVDKYWPDFSENDVEEILIEFSKRNRRYGR